MSSSLSVTKQICDAEECFAAAEEDIKVPVGQIGEISVAVCRKCKPRLPACEACILNSWKQFQSNSLPLEVFERWKELGLFAYGIAVVLGRLWRGENAGKHLNLVDADNQLALQEICSRNGTLEQLASWTLVEQHKDDVNRGHIYIVSTKPSPTKASDKGRPDTANKILTNEIPGIEVKNVGSLSFAWNSIHQGGHRYELVNGACFPRATTTFTYVILITSLNHG